MKAPGAVNRERLQQIEAVYHEALALDPDARELFLARTCSGDAGLRRDIESLLAREPHARDFIESPALEVAARLVEDHEGEPLIGRIIGHYRVLSLLGAGGMGEVYLAEDARLGRKLALKLLPEEFTRDRERVNRFEREARAASALNHPNILTIYEIGQAGGTHFIATELIDGQTLRQLLEGNRLSVDKALDIACQIASALVAAHQADIVHRDIKPENIMLRRDEYVKLLDFGLAKLVGVAPGPPQTNTADGVVLGTVKYMSPEQTRGLPLDARSDIFSLAVVLYEMIAGCVPFTGATTADVIASILGKQPAPQLARFTTGLPEALERAVARALRKDRDKRYQTAEDLLSDLRNLKRRLEFEQELKRTLNSDQTGTTAATARTPEGGGIPDLKQQDTRAPTILTPRPGLGGAEEEPAPRPKDSRDRVSKTRSGASRRSSKRAIRSIAVLPLINNGSDPTLDYLSDGVTEAIINTLAQLPTLRVVARGSVFRYKDRPADPREVGRLLNAQAVLSGRVRQVGDRIIVSIELVDVDNDSHLWGENYNRELSDIFEVQEEITREITGKLRLKLTRKEQSGLARRHTVNVEAYQAYLKGRYHWNKRTPESLNKGIEYFRQAIDLDPGYAAAYAGLSDSYTLLVVREAIPPAEGFAKAKASAMQALQIDEGFSEAHASLGHAMLHNWEWEDAETQLKRALELNPRYPSSHHWYSEHLAAMGRPDESIRELKLAGELDPLSLVISADLGRAYYYARRYDEVMKQEARTLEMDRNFWLSHINIGRSYTLKGMHQEAIAALERARDLSPGNTEVLSFLAFAYAAAAQKTKAADIFCELTAQSERGYVPPYHLAIIKSGLGEANEGFKWLERAFENHSVDLFTLKVEPMFDSLHSDPRFDDLLRRMALPPLNRRAEQKSLKAIAVLPFKPINTVQRDEYLELGMADALITKLSDISEIVVRPTSSVRKYTDLDQDSLAAGRELKVESVLEGCILRLGNRIRVTARLVSVQDGRSLWTGKFDENFTDIFEVEDLISERVADALAVKLTSEQRERLTKRYTENTAAYNLYLKGRYHWNKRSPERLLQGIECFNQAIEIDPGYALAHAGLADCYTTLGDFGVIEITAKDAFDRARRAALSALKIDNSLAEVYASLGHLDMHHLQWADAEKDLERSIELNPNYATAHQWYAYYMAFHHRFDEALAEITMALRLDPMSLAISDSVGEILYFARRYHEAIEQFQKTLEMDPVPPASRINLGRAYEQLAMFAEAENEFLKVRNMAGESTDALAALGHAYAASGRADAAMEILARLTELSKDRYVSPYDIALIHCALGQIDEAFRRLGEEYEQGVARRVYLTVDPRLDPIYKDPRFREVLRKVGLATGERVS